MESHPVPQNVTSFEFHLVGDMTLKQFAYLATGVGIAYLLFILIGTRIPLVAYPLIAFFALTGIAFAFVPISERPLDHWVGAFIQAITRPTQRSWQSPLKSFDQGLFNNRLSIYLSSVAPQMSPLAPIPPQPRTAPASAPPLAPAKPNPAPLQTAQQPSPNIPLQPPAPTPTPPTPPKAPSPPQVSQEQTNLPTAEELSKTVELAKRAQLIQSEIVQNEKSLEQIKANAAVVGADAKSYTENFQKVMDNLQKLTKEASEISRQMALLSQEPAKPITPPKVIVISPQKSAPIDVTLTSTPNVINGVVTDSLGNYLEGVIVVTHDKQGLPVRALKSNKLGQFVAATPLPAGTYTITLEKENLSFDTLQIELEGNVIPPILIRAKKGGL